jgi:hypothetical protein
MQSLFEAYFWGKGSYRTYWYAFFVAFPFTWRNVIIPNVAGGGLFNEYLDLTLYLADVLLLMCIINILKHENVIKSINNFKKMFHVERIVFVILFIYTLINFYIAPSKTLWIDAFLSILRAGLVAFITYYYFIIDKSCSTWNKSRVFMGILFLSVLVQLLIGFSQYTINSSAGFYYLGEQILSTEIPGVAEINSDHGKQLRSYGTFLHPNIFGGYIVVMFVIFYAAMRFLLFHVEQKWIIFKKFHVEQILLLISISFLLYIFINNDWRQSVAERINIFDNYHDYNLNLWGHGLRNDVYLLQFKNHSFWQLQPIHNIFYKVFFEYGYLGSVGLIIFLIYSFFKYIVPRGTIYLLPMIPLAIIGSIDHYLIDIYVGNILFGLSIGLALVLSSPLNIDKH